MNRKELFGCFVVEQADVDPREIEVVEATARNEFINPFNVQSLSAKPPSGLPSSAQHLPTFVQVFSIQISRTVPFYESQIPMFFLPIEPPMFMIFTFDSCCCANQSGHFRCVSSSVLIVGSSCTDSTEDLFCHEQYNPVRLLPVETSDLFWNPGSCMDI